MDADADRGEPPQPHPSQATVFVIRNGAYEPQYFMPIAPNPNTFALDGRDDPNPAFLRPNPPELKQTSLVKNPVNVHKASISVEGDSLTQHVLTFNFDSAERCEISIRFLQQEEHTELDEDDFATQFNLVDQANNPGPKNPIAPQRFRRGMDQRYRSEPFNLTLWPESRLVFSKDRPRDIPIVIEINMREKESAKENARKRRSCIQFTYVSVTPSSQNPKDAGSGAATCPFQAEVFGQKFQYGKKIYTLHEVFGRETKLAEAEVGDTNECVICMCEARDTAVLPCRHLCFCNYCAGIVRIQCDRCPICRAKVSCLLQFRRKTKEPVLPAIAAAQAIQTANEIRRNSAAADTAPDQSEDAPQNDQHDP